ncbi:MAG: ABC transporter ATP-binding protein [Clostridia bacterium]|nr:ABC transporter ATP-binding protein [Clostridia bacterium]
MLHIEHFSKSYGTKKAVDDLSLSIAPGEIYGFIGHNGAGKTTTLKACCGILQGDCGRITVGGLSMQEDPLGCKRLMAYIPDNPDLYDFLSGIKYLNFVADVYGVPADLRAERIRLYADRFELTKDLASPISAYSHGMKQKLAIVAAWLHSPRLIIMDEPFVGLDPRAAHILKGMMREHCDGGGAIFFSTHVLEVAEKLCDKVAIIQRGRLIAAGPMDEVKGDGSLESVFLELAGDTSLGGQG